MSSALIKCAVLMLVAVSHVSGQQDVKLVTEVCLQCICYAISGCTQQYCVRDTCGMFRITWGYWNDAGRHTVHNQSPDAPDAYPNCTNDPYCAALTVQGYMRRFAQDCNNDGQIDCYDYMAIHLLGGNGCSEKLPFDYLNSFNQCLSAAIHGQRHG